MALSRSRSLVLQTYPYGETSKILRLYTLEQGLVSVIAKGALRPKSRYGGILEPFTEGEALYYHKEGRDLHTLSGFDLVRSRQSLGRDLTRFAGAALVCELVLRVATEEPHSELYDQLTASLDVLADALPDETIATALTSVWRIVTILGFQPEMAACVNCGRTFGADEHSRFDVEAGGAACTTCRPAGRMVQALGRSEVDMMCRGHTPSDALSDVSLHRAMVRAFLGAHVVSGQPLRSLDLFMDASRPVTALS